MATECVSRCDVSRSKGYLGRWSEEIFMIDARLPTVPVTYRLKDLADEAIKGKFYELEIQKVIKSDEDYFDVDGEWEVTLSEISVPSRVYNVIEGLCYYDIYLSDMFARRINPTPGQYRRMRELIVELHRAQKEQIPLQAQEPLLLEFSYDSTTGKVKMAYRANAPRRIQVEFSQDLARVLGYTPSFVIRIAIRECRNWFRI